MLAKLFLPAAALFAFAQNGLLILDGIGDTAEIADSPSLSNLPEVTAEAWMYPVSGPAPGNGIEVVVAQYSSALGQRAYFIAYHRNFGRMRVQVNENTGGTSFDGNIPIQEDTWTHVAVTYDGVTLRLYVDGVLDMERNVSIPGPVTDFGIPIRIGSQSGSSSNQFPGALDDVRIWNTARSAAEIQAGMGGFVGPQPGLVGYWRMEDGAASPTIEDLSGFANHGVLLDDAVARVADRMPPLTASTLRGKLALQRARNADASGN